MVRLAKASDVGSTFNPTTVGATRACEDGPRKREVVLLCGASSTRRRQKRVYDLAAQVCWSWHENGLGARRSRVVLGNCIRYSSFGVTYLYTRTPLMM